jgi:predicted RNA-binding Zn-ribbon protein involved in translation (DUF1610 family)
MPELIDKAKLLEYLAAIKPDEYVSAYGEAAVDVINHVETYVNEMPTIEPEVRHGEWQCIGEYEEFGEEMADYLCKNCGCIISRQKNLAMPKYCENCGAKMDGGADNDKT